MPIKFKPNYLVTPKIMSDLLRIEAAKEKVMHLPLTPTVIASLRETARLFTTHYSTMIEGNVLSPDQVEKVLRHDGHFPGRERDEREVRGYYAGLDQVEKWASAKTKITETIIKTLHALVMADGRKKIKPTEYRDGQNVIRDGRTRVIIYMPPEAKDVSKLMKAMVDWINKEIELPGPIVAAIAHYQFATIHPYYDGNGRTARLLTTLILHQEGYDLKGLFSLEEYYARNLGAYYEAISVGDSHNYYMGRAEADITRWIEYFIEGMAAAFENVFKQMAKAYEQGLPDQSELLKKLEPRQRKVIQLFRESKTITSRQIGELFGLQPRTCSQICSSWVKSGFLKVANSSNKGRTYSLAKKFEELAS